MPRYDYQCDTCSHSFELKQSFDAEPTTTCPNCENTAHRKFSVVPVVFKGSGWYVNDYGKRGNSATSSTPKESKEPSESSKSDSRSEARSESTPKAEAAAAAG